MEDDQAISNKMRLSMDEIYASLLSCSEQKRPMTKTVHIYDPKELQTGWQTVSCNARYVACPDRRSPSVKSESSTSFATSATTSQKRVAKEKKKDIRQENLAAKFNKYESLGVLSYGVPSWRTIIDPETLTYLERRHPCSCNDSPGEIAEKGYTVRFLDPAGVLDQHLGNYVKRQRAAFADNVGSAVRHVEYRTGCNNVQLPVSTKPQNFVRSITLPFSIENLELSFCRKNLVMAAEIASTSSNPKSKSSVPPVQKKRQKHSVYNCSIPLPRKQLSPLLTSSKSAGRGDGSPSESPAGVVVQKKLPKELPPCNRPKLLAPVSFKIVKQNKKGQKLNWLPITSTSPYGLRSTFDEHTDEAEWSKAMGLSLNPVNRAITHLKCQMPETQNFSFTSEVRHGVPCEMVDLSLAPSGMN